MKTIAVAILFGLILAGCAGFEPPAALAMSTPYATDTATPGPQITPQPSATALVFKLLPSSTPIPTSTPAPTLEIYAYGPNNFPPEINPLTGLAPADPNLLNRRPMAIKVTNFPRSVRPQWGLSLADHVYEYYLENAISRFIGVFYGTDASRVGPVRSARLFDEHIMRMYKSIFVFGSADDRVLDHWLESDLKNSLVLERPDNCPPLCRIGSKGNYNTLFADTQKLSQYITERGTNNERKNLDGLYFNKTLPWGGQIGNQVYIRYSRVDYNRWDFDLLRGRYLRFQETQDEQDGQHQYEPHLDSLNGQQLAADNLIVLFIPHSYYHKSSDTEIFQMAFMGDGNGYALRDGQIFLIRWRRDAPNTLISLAFQNGQPYPLKPGNVWFQVLTDPAVIEQTPELAWSFKFLLPDEPTPTPTAIIP